MTKVEAINALIKEARSAHSPGLSRVRKVVRAYRALDLSQDEMILLGCHLEINDRNGRCYLRDNQAVVPWGIAK